MKVTSSKRKHLAQASAIGEDRASPIDDDRAGRIARTAAYLDATREQFAANARAARERFAGRVEGVLAGPTGRR